MSLTKKLKEEPKCSVESCGDKVISVIYPDANLEDVRLSCKDHEEYIIEKLKEEYGLISEEVYITDFTEIKA